MNAAVLSLVGWYPAGRSQILLVNIFIGGIMVRLVEDISNDVNGSPELAYRFLGLRSSDDAVVFMIVATFTMLAILGTTLVSEVYRHRLQQRLERQFSVCTMDPPHVRWMLRGIYACFLSHYKMEAASDARYMHDMLRKMLKAPVFLDVPALDSNHSHRTCIQTDHGCMLVAAELGAK